MFFREIPGQQEVKRKLAEAVDSGRIAHAQLFAGQDGSGSLALALAYAQYVACTSRHDGDSCGECGTCRQFARLAYPDLHLLFPQALTKKDVDKKGVGANLGLFRDFILANPYAPLQSWYDEIEMENRQGSIKVDDVEELSRKLSLRSFSGGYKFTVIWHAELMNTDSSNKMLKIFEEPPGMTIFLLIAETPDKLLPTVQSRMQLVRVPRIADSDIVSSLAASFGKTVAEAKSIAQVADGDYHSAMQLAGGTAESLTVARIREWLLICFDFPKRTKELMAWVDQMAESGREEQKTFLNQAIRVIRESMLYAVGADSLVKLEGAEREFIAKFSRFLTPRNSEEIIGRIGEACYHIERNAYGKLLFLDLSLGLGQLLKPKS